MSFLASFVFAWTSVSCLCRSVLVDHYWTFCREMYMTAVIQHCFRHSTPSVFRIYPVCVQDLPRLCSGSIPSVFRIYPVCVQDLSRLCSGSTPSVFRIYPVCVQDLSRLRSGSIPSVFRIYPVCVQDLPRLCSGSIPSAFRIYLRQRCVLVWRPTLWTDWDEIWCENSFSHKDNGWPKRG